MFYYGTQYYRFPNPPKEDWEEDFRRIKDHHFNIVKLWAMWNDVNPQENEFDFENLDELIALANKNDIKIIINIILENAPYWLVGKYPEAMYETNDGVKFEPIARANFPAGGFPGLCLDNEVIKIEAEKFLKALGETYLNNPALFAYDVWNEVYFEPANHPGFAGKYFCYCKGTVDKFVSWLKQKYNSIEDLSKHWFRKYNSWEDVYPPRFSQGYPDWIDWIKFRLWNQKMQMRWRVQTIRAIDKNHPLISHGSASTLWGMPTILTDDWDIAEEVDQWGFSAFPNWEAKLQGIRKADPCSHFCRIDLVRSASQSFGKKFWLSELQGGASAEGLRRSAIPEPSDIRVWNWSAVMGGCKGLMYWQWRPELLGPESPGFGLCNANGMPTERTKEASWFAEFLGNHSELAKAEPIRSEAGILILPESQIFCFVAERNTDLYKKATEGIYRALWENNMQCDFLKLDQINNYKLIYLPFPLMIEEESARRIVEYVRNGGILISEGCPAQFIDNGYSSIKIPGLDLDTMFGAVEEKVEYLQQDNTSPKILWENIEIPCALYRENFVLQGGKGIAKYEDGKIAMVENNFGEGKTLLIGTYPGMLFCRNSGDFTNEFIRRICKFANIDQRIVTTEPKVKARIHKGHGDIFLYVLNTDYQDCQVSISISKKIGVFKGAVNLVSRKSLLVSRGEKNTLKLELSAREGTVLKLLPS